MPAMSIIVPVYNVERYLPQCIDSIRRQTFTDIEVLCINDGSTDRSAEILALYERLDPRIRVISIANNGVSHARNLGIREASGKYLCFVDSDDLLFKDACKTCVDAFEENDLDIIKFSARPFPPSKSNYWINSTLSVGDGLFEGYSSELIFDEHSRPYPWNGAYRVSFLRHYGLGFPENLSLGEDQVFSFATLCRSRRTELISKQLYLYRLSRKDSLTALAADNAADRLKTHQQVVRAIAEDWKTAGLMHGESASRLLDFIVIFLLFDICELQNDHVRNELLASLRQLLLDEFSPEEVDRWSSGELVRDWLLKTLNYAGNVDDFKGAAIYGLTKAIYGRKAAASRFARDSVNRLKSLVRPSRPLRDEAAGCASEAGVDVDKTLARLHAELEDRPSLRGV